MREELLGTMSSLEKERHRAQTLQTLVATSSRLEEPDILENIVIIPSPGRRGRLSSGSWTVRRG